MLVDNRDNEMTLAFCVGAVLGAVLGIVVFCAVIYMLGYDIFYVCTTVEPTKVTITYPTTYEPVIHKVPSSQLRQNELVYREIYL